MSKKSRVQGSSRGVDCVLLRQDSVSEGGFDGLMRQGWAGMFTEPGDSGHQRTSQSLCVCVCHGRPACLLVWAVRAVRARFEWSGLDGNSRRRR